KLYVLGNHMKRITFALALFVLVCGCAKGSSTNTTPTSEDAKKFMDDVNDAEFKLANESSQAGWVSETYITDDTSALNARANQRLIDTLARYAKDAVKFDRTEISPDLRRGMNLLKVGLVMATPSDPKEGEELTTI